MSAPAARAAELARHTLRVLAEAKAVPVPGRAPLRRVVQETVQAWQAHVTREWQAPAASLLPALIEHAFREDLALERAREAFRQDLHLPALPARFVREDWRKRILALRSLDDAQKARLGARLRGSGLLEAEGVSLSVLLKLVELPEGLNGNFRQGFAAAFTEAMEAGRRGAGAQLGLGQDFLLRDPRASQALREYAGWYGDRLTKLVSLGWQQQVKQELIEGLDAGESAQELGARLASRFDELQGWQAERIARTEGVRARTEGARSTYSEFGVQEVVWIVADTPCDLCDPRAGKTYPIDSPDLPPAHPRCECTVAAAEGDLERVRREVLGEEGEPLPTAPARYGP